MTTTTEAPAPRGPAQHLAAGRDHRGSWVPSGSMIAVKIMELRKRRGLMVALGAVTVGIPAIFFAIRLILHAVAPHSYGPAGGYDEYLGTTAGVLYVFGFIVAATLGATAGSADLTEGMFRHHVITGRSRMALYLARIPAGLAIIWTFVATGFLIVCVVCVFAAPTSLNYNGAQIPAQLPRAQFDHWAADHAQEVINNFPLNIGPGDRFANSGCLPQFVPGTGPDGGGGKHRVQQAPTFTPCTNAARRSIATTIANQDYTDYAREFAYPSNSLMVKTGLWLELEAAVGFLIGLGISSLLGQRTISVILLIVLEVIITPIALRAKIPHMVNLQRGVVGLATAHLEPGGLPPPFGGNSPSDQMMAVHESTEVAICVLVGWILVWSALGAWRMMRRDA